MGVNWDRSVALPFNNRWTVCTQAGSGVPLYTLGHVEFAIRATRGCCSDGLWRTRQNDVVLNISLKISTLQRQFRDFA